MVGAGVSRPRPSETGDQGSCRVGKITSMALTLVSNPGSWLLDVRLTKYELLVSVDDAFAALARELGGVQGQALDLPPRDGGWSIADHVAHLAGWEALELARV